MTFDDLNLALNPLRDPRIGGCVDAPGIFEALTSIPPTAEESKVAEGELDQLERAVQDQGDETRPKGERPEWLRGRTKPTSKVPALADYRRALQQFGAKDSEEFRQKYLAGFDAEDFEWLKPEPPPRAPADSVARHRSRASRSSTKTSAGDPARPAPEPRLVPRSVAAAQVVRNRQGLDAGFVRVEISPAEQKRLAALAKTTDAREELAVSAVQSSGLGYSDAAIQKVMARYGDARVFTNASAEETKADLAGKEPVQVALASGIRRELYRADLELKGDPTALARYDFKLKVEDEKARIEADFAKITPKNGLHEAFLALAKENALKGAIDRITAESGDDVRRGSGQKAQVNAVADSVQGAFDRMLGSHPVYGMLPSGVRSQISEFGVGVLKGGVQLVGTVKGANDFVADAVQDLLVTGAEKSGLAQRLGVDTRALRKDLEAKRTRDAQLWSDITSAETKRSGQGSLGYETKRSLGLRTTPYDIPNWAEQAGVLTTKAAPYIAVGLATGGASVPVQVAANAAIAGTTAGGEVYNQTRSQPEALKAASWGAASGAVMPLSNRLGYAGDLAFSSAFDYVTTKLRDPNASDDQIVFGMLTQAASSGALQTGGKLNRALAERRGRSLGADEARAEYESLIRRDLPVLKEEVANSAKRQTQEVVERVQSETRAIDAKAKVTLDYRPLPAASPKANGQNLVARVDGYNQKHDPKFTEGMAKSIDEAVVGLAQARAKGGGSIEVSDIEAVMGRVGQRRGEIQIQRVQTQIAEAARSGRPWSGEKQRRELDYAKDYGKPLPEAPSAEGSAMIDRVTNRAGDRHRAYYERIARLSEQYLAGDGKNELMISVEGRPTKVQLSTPGKLPWEADTYIVEHPKFGESQLLTRRAHELLAEVASNKTLTEAQAMEKVAEAHYLYMHGTPFKLGSPAAVEATIDAVLRERFGKSLPSKKAGVEPFWEAVLSSPGEAGLRDYVRRFRSFYED